MWSRSLFTRGLNFREKGRKKGRKGRRGEGEREGKREERREGRKEGRREVQSVLAIKDKSIGYPNLFVPKLSASLQGLPCFWPIEHTGVRPETTVRWSHENALCGFENGIVE